MVGFTHNSINILKKNILVILISFPVILQFGCQRRSNRWSPGESFKTQIIVATTFGTKFQVVDLLGIVNKSTLEGEIADYYFAPGEKNGKIMGEKPLAKFVESKGVFIPADQLSLQMVTIYYHLQELKKIELQATGLEKSIIHWPRQVGLSVQVINAPDMKYDNAFYNGKIDALYFVPYKDSRLPIPLNLGIIAHEHFHSYFSYQVLNPLMNQGILPTQFENSTNGNSLDDVYNFYILKIINEGLADVWGWLYSHDPDFVAISLTKVGSSRKLENESGFFPNSLSTQNQLRNEVSALVHICESNETRCLTGDAYAHGTKLARTLKSFAQARMDSSKLSDSEMRSMMAREILKLIGELKIAFVQEGTLSLEKLVSIWEKQFEVLSASECKVLQQAINSGDVKCADHPTSSLQ
jgi:hypothetical protein